MNDLISQEAAASGAVPVSPDVSAVQPESVAQQPTQQEAAAVSTIDDDLQKVWDKFNPPRDGQNGQFQAKAPVAVNIDPAKQNSEGQSPEAAVTEPAAKPAIGAPHSWPKEMQDKWASLPPDVQEFAARRDKESQAQISRMGNQLKQYEPVSQVLERHQEAFTRRGLTYQDGVHRLLDAQRQLDENPVAAIAAIARTYGVDLSMFGAKDGEGQPSQSPMVASLQAEISGLRRELNETRGIVTTREQREADAHRETLTGAIEKFLDGKPDLDNDEAQAELANYVEMQRKQNPAGTPDAWLSAAYDLWQYATPDRRTAQLNKQRVAEESERLAKAKKEADDAKRHSSLNVKSSPASPSSAQTIDQTLEEIARRHGMQ